MLQKILAIIIGLIVIAIVSYSGWKVARVINYNVSYKDMVIETIKENIKEECIK